MPNHSPQVLRGFSLSLLSAGMLLLSGCSTVSGLWEDSPAQRPEASVAQVGDISVLWRNNVDQRRPASPPGFSLPAVIAGSQGELIIAGGQDRRVRIYRSGGSEVDRLTLENPLESGALQLTNGVVVIGDVGGVLYGLDINAVRVVWKRQLSAALMGVPVAVGDDFIIQTSDNQIYRLTADGKKIWSYSPAQVGGLGSHLTPSPVVYKDHVFAVFANGDVVALKADNGSFLWSRQLLLSNDAAVMSEVKIPTATPLIIPASQSSRHEDVLMVSIFQGEITALSLQDGSTLATRNISLKSTPLLVGRTVFVADANGAVSALDSTGMETLWKKQLSDGELTGPVLWQGSLWVADEHGRVFRLDQKGTLLASIELDGRIDRKPVVSAVGVLVRNHLGTLYLLN